MAVQGPNSIHAGWQGARTTYLLVRVDVDVFALSLSLLFAVMPCHVSHSLLAPFSSILFFSVILFLFFFVPIVLLSFCPSSFLLFFFFSDLCHSHSLYVSHNYFRSCSPDFVIMFLGLACSEDTSSSTGATMGRN
ncbi:MAG: hypothetical protein BYD32DRAFT_114403 [Podila humilis]|nr:MAG: hypothetical protein BYD32DRAFT_114403 [Podila humilis]